MSGLRVTDVTELLYRLRLREFEEHFKKVKEYKGWLVWVSALTQCPRKWLYMLRFPELSQVEFRGAFFLGRAAHIGMQQLLQDYAYALGYDRIDVEVEVGKMLVFDGENIFLAGRIDALAYRDGEKVVYEIKTARGDAGLPHEHHLLQLRIYMNIVDAAKGILLYLTPDRVAEYHVDESIDNEELMKIVREFLEFRGPRYDWECSYCPYSTMCPYKKINRRR